ncbi:homoserine O-acetyltransferase [Oerskovia sp. M15]
MRVAYETWGTLAPDGSNAVLVLHALTGDSHVVGPTGPGHLSAGWWEAMVGPGAPIDTDRYFVVAPNVLGGCQGTTGPASDAPDGEPWGGRFPRVTTRDQVAVEIELTRALGISAWALVIGASMGGLRVLEWAILGPESGVTVESVAVVASTAQTSGDQIAWAHPSSAPSAPTPGSAGPLLRRARRRGPHVGLGIARQIAHATYRSARELDERFGRLPQGGEDPFTDGRYAVQSYLDHHGDKLSRRFDANSYVVLTESMLTHDLGRDRGASRRPLRRSRRVRSSWPWTRTVSSCPRSPPASPGHPGARPLRLLHSEFGHDGFLIEFDQLGPMVTEFLEERAQV